jgi:TM2 domain-containing membrane protein YozV
MKYILLTIFFILSFSGTFNAEGLNQKTLFLSKEMAFSQTTHHNFIYAELSLLKTKRPSPLFKLFHDKQRRNKKITAAALSFPFPFGIVGLHRIYLGCPPYIPVVYIGTLGGVFGTLPLIDFFLIVFDKNFENYFNNPRVFMWVK